MGSCCAGNDPNIGVIHTMDGSKKATKGKKGTKGASAGGVEYGDEIYQYASQKA